MLIHGAQVECDDKRLCNIPHPSTTAPSGRCDSKCKTQSIGRLDISDHTDGKDVTVFVGLETNDDIRRDGSIKASPRN